MSSFDPALLLDLASGHLRAGAQTGKYGIFIGI